MPLEPGQQPAEEPGEELADEFEDDLVIPLEPTRNGW